MIVNPETRESLILRLADHTDNVAWSEFLDIYEPMLGQLASRWGLQKADADEVVQETLLAVANAIPQYQSRPHRHAFRGWLAAITRNKLADLLSRRRRQVNGSGDTDVHRWLDQHAEPTSQLSVWDWNQKQQIFQWAAKRVRGEVKAHTWQAFHRTSVLGESVAVVAAELDIRQGMVHVARSRVMLRLRDAIAVWESSSLNHPLDASEVSDEL